MAWERNLPEASCSVRSSARNPQPAAAAVYSTFEREGELVVPLCVEELSIARRRVVTGRARIVSTTTEREEQVEVPLIREQVEIERRTVGEQVESVPSIRQEGETIVIPVMEEQWFLERRLILKEEIRVTRVRRTEVHRERVVTRRHEVEIARLEPQLPER